MSQALVGLDPTELDREVPRSTAQSKARGSQRLPELDALRGLMLTLMTLAHLPTQAQVITNQQLGFVSEAEGFVFLSAFLTGRILTEPVMKGISAISFSSFELRGQEDDGQSPACYGLFERIASESGFPR